MSWSFWITYVFIFLLVRTLPSLSEQVVDDKAEYSDYYSSLVGIQRLAIWEHEFVKVLAQFRQELENQTLSLVDTYLNDFHECKVEKNVTDPVKLGEKISANPVLVFRLLRRLTKNLDELAPPLLNSNDSSARCLNHLMISMKMPQQLDVEGAAAGILRLQDAYKLPTEQISVGRLLGKETGCGLRAVDMHLIGAKAVLLGQSSRALEWLEEALTKVKKGDSTASKELLETHVQAMFRTNMSPKGDKYEDYLALCRGEGRFQNQNLRCFYSTKFHPFNLLSPLKVEMLHRNPSVLQIYELLSDKVTTELRSSATPRLKRARIFAPDQDEGIYTDVRTASVTFLPTTPEYWGVLNQVQNAAERATCLNVIDAVEDLQICSYASVGGHFVPHMDTLFDNGRSQLTNPEQLAKGERMATLMFYLTDVELGGGTVFPKLGVVAQPVKGSALFWYNVKQNGEKNMDMIHAGCPVLYGNKWVSNKWIRMNAQWNAGKCLSEEIIDH